MKYTEDGYGKIYRAYNVKSIESKSSLKGISNKIECDMRDNGVLERGIFKEKLREFSKDHIMEQFVYKLALQVGVQCCKASCRQRNGIIGSFSRYEIPVGYIFIHLSDIMKEREIGAEELIIKAIEMSKGVNRFVRTIYQYMLFDFLVGQQDRHLENLAVLENKKTNRRNLYPLYDNGLCCFSHIDKENAIELLHKGFYNSCNGPSEDIIKALVKYRNIVFYNVDLATVVNYKIINVNLIEQLLNEASKYDKLGKQRTIAVAEFIKRQAYIIHCINYGKEIPPYEDKD